MSRSSHRTWAPLALLMVLVLLLALWLLRPDPGADLAQRPEAPETTIHTPQQQERASRRSSRPDRAQEEPSEGQRARPLKTEPLTLDNGLTVILVEDRSTPTVAAHVVVRAGSTDDSPGLEGTAHFLEHMMFKGTDRMGTLDWEAEAPHILALAELQPQLLSATGSRREELAEEALEHRKGSAALSVPYEYARLLTELGATTLNAATALEYTDYYAVLPASCLEHWARTEAERFTHPVFRGLAGERRVIQRELRSSRVRAEWKLRWRMRGALFPGHAYGQPLGGTPASVAEITADDLEAFFDTWYVPRNMAVILVGDFSASEAWELVDESFGALPDLPVPSRSRHTATPTRVRQRLDGGARRSTIMAWPVVGASDREWVALQVVAGFLAGRLDDAGARDVDVGLHRMRDGGFLELLVTHFGREPDVEAVVREGLRQLADGGLGELNLQAARLNTQVSELERLESPNQQARTLAKAFSRHEGPREAWERVLALHTVRSEDMAAVVEEYLDDGLVVVPADRVRGTSLSIRGESRRVDLERYEDQPLSDLAAGILALPEVEIEPHWLEAGQDYTRTERVIAVPNPCNTLFQLDLRYPVGWLDEPGLCVALEQWEDARMEPKLGSWGQDLVRSGVRFDTRCAADQVTLSLRGPGEAASGSVALLYQALQSPVLASPVRPSMRAWDTMTSPHLRDYARYGQGAATLDLPAFQSLVSRSTRQQQDALRALLSQPVQATYAGPADASEVDRWLPVVETEAWPPLLPEPVLFAQHRVLQSERDTRLLRWGEVYDPEHEGLYALVDTHLTGAGGLIGETLRRRGDVYSPFIYYSRGASPGERNLLEVASLFVRSRELSEVVELIVDLASDASLSRDRWEYVLSTTQQRLWSEHHGFRRAGPILLSWQERGLDTDPRELAWEQLRHLGQADLEDFLAQEAATPWTLVLPGAQATRSSVRQRWGEPEPIPPLPW